MCFVREVTGPGVGTALLRGSGTEDLPLTQSREGSQSWLHTRVSWGALKMLMRWAPAPETVLELVWGAA